MRKKYLRFEQLEVFRPMPLPDTLRQKIEQDCADVKILVERARVERDTLHNATHQPCEIFKTH